MNFYVTSSSSINAVVLLSLLYINDIHNFLPVTFFALGAKLCMLLDLLGSSGSLTGVDIAKHRLAACRTMLQKYALGNRCRLFAADGTSFSLLPLSSDSNIKSSKTQLDL